jgi:hypothetical protein
MLDQKELIRSKQLKALIDEAIKSPKGVGDLFIAQNGKTYKLEITLAKK